MKRHTKSLHKFGRMFFWKPLSMAFTWTYATLQRDSLSTSADILSPKVYVCLCVANGQTTPKSTFVFKTPLCKNKAVGLAIALNSRKIRNDFPTFQLQWMLFVTWQKCKGNADFRHLLLCIPRDITLVRDKTEDHFQSATLWGCRNMERHYREKRLWKDFSCRGDDQDPKEWRQKLNREREKLKNIGEWKGQNNMGKILMICRDCLIGGNEPPIDYDLLNRSNIYLLGERLTF